MTGGPEDGYGPGSAGDGYGPTGSGGAGSAGGGYGSGRTGSGGSDDGRAAAGATGSGYPTGLRVGVDGLGSSAPLGTMLPAVFADDDLAQRFVAGLDEVLAPILNVLDCLDRYFDPALTPVDFAAWLGTWVGAETDGTEPEARLRDAVASAAALHRVRGTRQGLSEAVRLAFGVTPDITESGGADWNARPLGPFPGAPRPRLHVALRLPAPTTTDVHRLDSLVAAARPAHMPYTVEVTTSERTLER